MDKEKNFEVNIKVVSMLKYPVDIEFCYAPYKCPAVFIGKLEPEEYVSYTVSPYTFQGSYKEHDEEKYAKSYHFGYGDWFSPPINMITKNDQKKFELYSLPEEDDQIHRFDCREISDQSFSDYLNKKSINIRYVHDLSSPIFPVDRNNT